MPAIEFVITDRISGSDTSFLDLAAAGPPRAAGVAIGPTRCTIST